MINAVCLGGTQISVDPGYWRNNTNSTEMFECLREDSCKGGYHSANTHPVECATGHTGILCGECEVSSEGKYENIGNYECAKCPDPVLNAIRMIGLLALTILFMILLIIMNLRKKEDSQISILLKIMTNYLQVITVVLSFNINYPDEINEIFIPADRVGSTSTPFVSFDCFARDQELTFFTPSPAFLKVFLSGLLPIVLFSISLMVWTILYFSLPKWCSNWSRNVMVTNIAMLFLIHPNITRMFLTIFQCVDITEDEARVRVDLQMVCYSAEHLGWCSILGLPSIIFWSIGIPLAGFILIFRNRKRLDDEEVRKYYLMLYQGMKYEKFYWEFVNTLRKMLLVSFNVFLSTYSLLYKLMANVILLLTFFRIQQKLEPYKLQCNNIIERKELIAGIMTIFAGTLFINPEDEVSLINLIAFFGVLALNARFILHWVYLVLLTQHKTHSLFYHLASILRMLLCLKKEAEPNQRSPKKKKKLIFKKMTKSRKKKNKKTKKGSKNKLKQQKKKEFYNMFDNEEEKEMPADRNDRRTIPFQEKSSHEKSKSQSKYIDDSVNHEDYIYRNPNRYPNPHKNWHDQARDQPGPEASKQNTDLMELKLEEQNLNETNKLGAEREALDITKSKELFPEDVKDIRTLDKSVNLQESEKNLSPFNFMKHKYGNNIIQEHQSDISSFEGKEHTIFHLNPLSSSKHLQSPIKRAFQKQKYASPDHPSSPKSQPEIFQITEQVSQNSLSSVETPAQI